MSYLGRSAKLVRRTQEKTSFLATAGQTEVTGLSYVSTFVEVRVNGIILTDVTDYTATNGNSITFPTALSLDDEVTIVALRTFALADHYSKTEGDALYAHTVNHHTKSAADTLLDAKAALTGATFTGAITATTFNGVELAHADSHNLGLGHSAIAAITTGDNNIGVGINALASTTTGGLNIAVGRNALLTNITGGNNTALGGDALRHTTSSNNTGVGYDALEANTSGTGNIALGAFAGDAITTGSNNTVIGRASGTTTMSDTVLIAAGTTERLKINASGIQVNGSALAITDTTGLQTALDGKVDDSQVLTNVPSGAVFTDTTYTVGDGGLTTNDFTNTDHSKLDNVEASADVTDTANVTSSGALMDSELTSIDAVKALNQGVATTDAVDFTAVDLTAIAASKSVTAVDVFVYDTSKDSDGGQWRKRTQGTSWYNEALNTSTRGSRKEFPAVAVIVAEAAKVTIYDGDDPSMPMWMVFTRGVRNFIPQYYSTASEYVSSVSCVNSELTISIAGDGLQRVSFLQDNGYMMSGTNRDWNRNIAGRNSNTQTDTVMSGSTLVSRYINDIAMTVLPNAPIDSATGLPIPTIAVATNGGVSVIKDDGSVVDIVITQTYKGAGKVEFLADNRIAFTAQQSGGDQDYYHYNIAHIPTTDLSNSYWQSYPDSELVNYAYGYYSSGPWLAAGPFGQPTYAISNNVVGGYRGLGVLKEDKSNTIQGSVAYITSDYNTGYMVGDIKLAALSDTDATDVVGSELVTNGTFDSDASGWAAQGDAALTHSNGMAVGTLSSAAGMFTQSTAISLNVGDTVTYSLFWDASSTHGNLYLGFINSVGAGVLTTHFSASNKGKTVSVSYTATSTGTYSPYFQGYYWGGSASGQTVKVDNISVRLVDSDRSVNGNGLAVHGTITKTAVATGADLVAYSGFSSSNYLEQPYNSDLDFGTGDFSIMGWVKSTGSAAQMFVDNRSSTDVAGFSVEQLNGGTLRIRAKASDATESYTNGTVSVSTGAWVHFSCVVSGGGTQQSIYVNSALDISAAVTAKDVGTTSPLWIGVAGGYGNVIPALYSSLSLLRISATAPSAQQIKDIYEAEKPLFQENAQATLYGTSDAVTALAHDSDTNLLHVGTSSGRSVFQGLRRVDNTTSAVGSAISASNNLVVED